jgi:hypothetical protein
MSSIPVTGKNALEITPYEEVQWCYVRGTWRPRE